MTSNSFPIMGWLFNENNEKQPCSFWIDADNVKKAYRVNTRPHEYLPNVSTVTLCTRESRSNVRTYSGIKLPKDVREVVVFWEILE